MRSSVRYVLTHSTSILFKILDLMINNDEKVLIKHQYPGSPTQMHCTINNDEKVPIKHQYPGSSTQTHCTINNDERVLIKHQYPGSPTQIHCTINNDLKGTYKASVYRESYSNALYNK